MTDNKWQYTESQIQILRDCYKVPGYIPNEQVVKYVGHPIGRHVKIKMTEDGRMLGVPYLKD